VVDLWPGWGHLYVKVKDKRGVHFILKASPNGTGWEKVLMEVPKGRERP